MIYEPLTEQEIEIPQPEVEILEPEVETVEPEKQHFEPTSNVNDQQKENEAPKDEIENDNPNSSKSKCV